MLLLVSALGLTGCLAKPSPSDAQSDFSAPPPVAVGTCPWAGFELAPTTSTDPLVITEHLALPDELFWPVIESIPDLPEQGDFDAVSSALAGCPASDLVAFDARLTLALYALDGPRSFDWIKANDPMGLPFASADSFLYSRCATVLGGHASWSDAVDAGTLDWGTDQPDTTGVSELLLYVGLTAAEAQGTSMEEYFDSAFTTIPLSYETGSNTALWGE